MEQRETNAQFGEFLAGQLRGDLHLNIDWRWATRAKVRIGELECSLVPVGELSGLEPIVDELGKFFGETVLPRDREANVASIGTVDGARIAKPHGLFRRLIEHAVAPEL